MRTHSLDILPGLCHRFRTGTRLRNNNFQEAQPRFQKTQGSGKVPRFRKQPRGSDIRRGLYQGSCYGQGPRKPIFKETKVPGPYRPCQRAIADRGGHSVTINQRVSVPQTQGSNIRCGLCQGSGNEGSRKTRFQEHKGFRKSPSQSWVLCGGFRTCRFMFVCSVGAQRRSTDLF